MARRWLAVVMAAGWTVLVPLLAAAQDGQDDIPELVSSRMTLDGRADDWQAIEPVVVDDDSETADHPPPGGDLHSLRLAADPDGRFVYWMIDLVDPPVGSGVLFHVVLRRDAETSLAEVFVERLVDGSLRCEVGRHRLEGPGEWEWRPVVDDPTNCAVDEIVEGRLPAWLFDNDARIGIGPFEWMATATGDGDRFEDHFQPPAGTSPDQWRFWRRLPRRSITGEVRCEGGCGEGGRLRLLAAGHLDFTAPAVAAAWLDGPGFFDLSLPMGSRLSLPMGSRVYLLGFWDADGNGALSVGDVAGFRRWPVPVGETGVTVVLGHRVTALPVSLPPSGDITGDRLVDVGDGIAAMQVLVGAPPADLDLAAWYDADGDGRFDLSDVVAFLQEIARP